LQRPVELAQYTALRFTQRLADAGVAPSTGRVGDSYDNALAENLWSSIKIELLYWAGTQFATRAEAEATLLRYIDGWYNPAVSRNDSAAWHPRSTRRLGTAKSTQRVS
jgi:putative transposase